MDLGASPDYKDSRGLTPLYHSAMVGGDPYCCELLLHDHAQVGCEDENGWQEIHQVIIHHHIHKLLTALKDSLQEMNVLVLKVMSKIIFKDCSIFDMCI